MIAIADPQHADAVMVGKAMPPLWQNFSRLQKRRQRKPHTGELEPLGGPGAAGCPRRRANHSPG
jgi:hypothetical protein